MAEDDLKTLLLANEAKIAPTVDLVNCENFAEYLDYCDERELRDLAEAHGLVEEELTAGEAYERIRAHERQRASWLGLVKED